MSDMRMLDTLTVLNVPALGPGHSYTVSGE